MELGTSDWEEYAAGSVDQHIPIDLFGSKNHTGVPRGVLSFADASGNILFTVHRHPLNPNPSSLPKDTKTKLLLDSSANPLFSILRHQKGSWKCCKGSGDGEKEMVFRVVRTLKTLSRVDLEVFFSGERLNDDVCDLKVRGSPFKRSCTIYKGTDLVAQVWKVKPADGSLALFTELQWVTFCDPESARRACGDPNTVIIDERRANCNVASLGRL